MFIAIFVVILRVQSAKTVDMMMTNSDKYGPFNLKSVDVEKCHGPKTIDLSELNCTLKRNSDDDIISTFETYVADAIKLDEVKIMVYNLQNGKKNIMWNYKFSDPCKHFAVGSVIALHLKAEKCVVKPGRYVFEVNITELVKKFFGNTFFYGDYYFKSLVLAKKGNLACLLFHQVFEKKIAN